MLIYSNTYIILLKTYSVVNDYLKKYTSRLSYILNYMGVKIIMFNYTIKTKKRFYLILMLGAFFIFFTNCNKNSKAETKRINLTYFQNKLDLMKYSKKFIDFPKENSVKNKFFA